MNKDLTPLSCPNCGAPINRVTMKCEYCGTVFREDRYQNLIVVESPSAIPIMGRVKMPFEFADMVGRDKAEEIVRNELYNAMKSELIKCIDLVCTEDPITMSFDCRGRLRVIPSGYRF